MGVDADVVTGEVAAPSGGGSVTDAQVERRFDGLLFEEVVRFGFAHRFDRAALDPRVTGQVQRPCLRIHPRVDRAGRRDDARGMGDFGIVRRELGKVEQAREINEDTLNKTRAVFGNDHEHTLITANSYACDLRIAGDYTGALQLDETLYAQHRRVFGENEDATFRSAHNLAIDMRLNGRFRDAYELDMENLQLGPRPARSVVICAA